MIAVEFSIVFMKLNGGDAAPYTMRFVDGRST